MKGYYVWNFSNKRGRSQTINKQKPPRCPFWVYIQIDAAIHRYQLSFSPEISAIASMYEYSTVKIIQSKDDEAHDYVFHFSYKAGYLLRHKSKSRTVLNCKPMIEFVISHIPSSKVVMPKVDACVAALKPFSCFIMMGDNTSEHDDEAKFPFYDIIK